MAKTTIKSRICVQIRLKEHATCSLAKAGFNKVRSSAQICIHRTWQKLPDFCGPSVRDAHFIGSVNDVSRSSNDMSDSHFDIFDSRRDYADSGENGVFGG